MVGQGLMNLQPSGYDRGGNLRLVMKADAMVAKAEEEQELGEGGSTPAKAQQAAAAGLLQRGGRLLQALYKRSAEAVEHVVQARAPPRTV